MPSCPARQRASAHPPAGRGGSPSGIGDSSVDDPFRADFTYATGSVKAPLLEERHRAAVGRLRYLDLGFFAPAAAGVADPDVAGVAGHGPRPRSLDRVLKSSVLSPADGTSPRRSADKRTFGHLFVVGGSRQYPGAVLMNVRAALRSGAGLVTAFVPESLAPRSPHARRRRSGRAGRKRPRAASRSTRLAWCARRIGRATVLALGSGLGAEGESLALVSEILKLGEQPAVLDADALRPEIVSGVPGARIVLLPHAGEFKRLAGGREASTETLRALVTRRVRRSS